MLKDLGLFSAVENLVLAFKKSNAISIKFISDIENDPIPYTTSLALYRIVQESLSNIIYHSGAKNCSVSLMKRTGLLLLNIKDDGCGFDILKIDTKFSHGILGMRERAYAINGKFNINSALAEGTVIEIEVPI